MTATNSTTSQHVQHNNTRSQRSLFLLALIFCGSLQPIYAFDQFRLKLGLCYDHINVDGLNNALSAHQYTTRSSAVVSVSAEFSYNNDFMYWGLAMPMNYDFLRSPSNLGGLNGDALDEHFNGAKGSALSTSFPLRLLAGARVLRIDRVRGVNLGICADYYRSYLATSTYMLGGQSAGDIHAAVIQGVTLGIETNIIGGVYGASNKYQEFFELSIGYRLFDSNAYGNWNSVMESIPVVSESQGTQAMSVTGLYARMKFGIVL